MNFEELRSQYESISYDSFKYIEKEKSIDIFFCYTMKDIVFSHNISIPKKDFFILKNSQYKEVFLFNLGLMEIINYYKLACPKKILLKAGALSKEQIIFWRKLFYKGLGEFRYVNNIDVSEEDFVVFENKVATTFNKTKIKSFSGNIIPIGGGKDSAVTLELLKDQKSQNIPFIINPRGATLDTARVAGYSIDETIEVYREIDPQLLELNKKGYLNGHVPFSAMIAFLSMFCALMTNKKYIVLSNESSADENTDERMGVNHQYSKTLEFEKDFAEYAEKYINSEIKYFSLLRGFREIDIVKMFAKYKQYHKVFRSCNLGSKNGKNEWCGKCAKCLFVYIMLSPFLSIEEVNDIFGKNLLDDIELLKYLRELAGFDETKPFECVGTRAEVNEAMALIIEKYKDKELPVLLKEYIKARDKEQTV